CPPSAPATAHHNNGRALAPPSRAGHHNTVPSHPALVFRYPPPLRRQTPTPPRDGKPTSYAQRPLLDKTHPEPSNALAGVTRDVRRAERAAGLSRALTELVNVRVSQLNGCPACLSVHVPAARRAGVSELKLDLLPSWQDAEIYTEEERIALELAE